MARKRDLPADDTAPEPGSNPRRSRRHCNGLDGKRWIQNSISVWSDIRKTPEELRLKHPALFPTALVERLIETFLAPDACTVLDPFTGCGSTLVAAAKLGRQGVGLELSPEYVALARSRLAALARSGSPSSDAPATGPTNATGQASPAILHQASAADLERYVAAESIDLCITSPPYWNILNQRRTADFKATRHYGNLHDDLGTIDDYDEFLTVLTGIFRGVLRVLKPGAYCCIAVMDLRKKNRFFPFHSDLAGRLVEAGFLYDDLIIWNRQAEYNNLRPLGYPSVFRVNKVHEFVILMQKPRSGL